MSTHWIRQRIRAPRRSGRRLTNGRTNGGAALGASRPIPSADGKWLYFLEQELSTSGTDFVPRNTALYVLPGETVLPGGALPAGASAAARRLTDPEHTDLTETGIVPVDGSRVLVFNRARGAVELLALDAGEHRAVLPRRGNPSLGRRVSGHGWVFLDAGPGPHPVLLNIHGGPFSQFDWSWFDEAQTYAAAGYAVVQCNPRGFLDPLSFIGSSDIGWFFSAAYTGADPERVLAQRPMARAASGPRRICAARRSRPSWSQPRRCSGQKPRACRTSSTEGEAQRRRYSALLHRERVSTLST